MTMRLTPQERADLDEFHNELRYDSERPVHQWQRYERGKARVDVLLIYLGVAVILLAVWTAVVWYVHWLAVHH